MMNPQQFPLLLAAARNASRFEQAVAVIAASLNAGEIRNAIYKEAKDQLSRVVSDAWEKLVSDRYFRFGAGQSAPEDVKELYFSIGLYGLHEVLATSRKLAKTSVQGEAVDAMRNLINEALPLAQAVASLKAKVVKGRAPREVPVPENPNKIVRTCPCCFRKIAVVRGTMAHHGYRRPRRWMQTASCYGIRFRPLEVSSEGLVWLINAYQDSLARAEHDLAHIDTVLFLMAQDKEGAAVKVLRDSPEWPLVLRRHLAELSAEMESLKREIPKLEEKLKNWRPQVMEDAPCAKA